MAPSQITIANNGTDGGDFLAAALTGGIPHPTGYPTYTLLLRAFEQLPISTAYFRGSLFSAISASLTVLLVSVWIARKSHYSQAGRVGSLVGGTALGFSPLFWSQAVIVEVQALQGLFVILMIWWITFLAEDGLSRFKKWSCLALALVGGLSLGNHLTILFLLPIVGLAAWQAKRIGQPPNWLLAQAAVFGAGLLIYAYLPLAASRNPPVVWGNPETVNGFWWVVSGSLYQGMVFGVSLVQAGGRIFEWGRLFLAEFTLPAMIAVLWSLRLKNAWPIRWGLVWVFLIYSVFYFSYASRDAVVYLIAPWIIASVWIGEGVARLWQWRTREFAIGVLTSGIILFCLVARVPLAWGQVDPARDRETVKMLEEAFARIPQNAILITWADEDTFPIWYSHFGLGMRPDLHVIVKSLTNFEWYRDKLRSIYPDLVFPTSSTGSNWIDLLTALNTERPACQSKLKDNDSVGKIVISCSGVIILESDYFSNNY